jgi:hypothetical protein
MRRFSMLLASAALATALVASAPAAAFSRTSGGMHGVGHGGLVSGRSAAIVRPGVHGYWGHRWGSRYGWGNGWWWRNTGWGWGGFGRSIGLWDNPTGWWPGYAGVGLAYGWNYPWWGYPYYAYDYGYPYGN